jgi:DNA invertase Pin-like site-specific DNA recombinase
MAEAPTLRRCAVYTRKSTEEGLDMDFNSLQAQREACEAYIASQRGEGWRLISAAYDDGGISGGTMDRPGLVRLLADIEAGKVDVVVVYKVDRLTRSLSDFSKMVEVFDRKGVSFVAVTQHFNTTTSMGRLTLNVLLSFAQFEREVTGERIRDKIAASKRKGIWMGGAVPHGYRVEDRKLVVVPERAEMVREIYRQYLKCSGIRDLALYCQRAGVRLSEKGNGAISRGALYALLRNPIYAGLIAHKKDLYPGQHQAIVDRGLWDAVQEKLADSRRCRGRPRRKTEPSPLMGKIFDEAGRKLTPTHAVKGSRYYRYYESHSDAIDEARLDQTAFTPWRLPAQGIEQRVVDVVQAMLVDRAALARAAVEAGIADIQVILEKAAALDPVTVLDSVKRVQLFSDRLMVEIALPGQPRIPMKTTVPMVLKRRGVERRVVVKGSSARIDHQAIKALSRGLRFWERANSDAPITAVEFAEAEGVDNRYIGRALPLAFLAPDIVGLFASGRQPADWSAKRLLCWDDLPLGWGEQRKVLGLI